MKKVPMFIFLFALLFGCKKSENKPLSASDCLLEKYGTTDNSIVDQITYDANGQVTRVDLIGGGYTSIIPLRDANNLVNDVQYYIGTTLVAESKNQFDANDRVITILLYKNNVLAGYTTWSYIANSTRPSEQEIYSIDNGNTRLSEIDHLAYDTRGNLVSGAGDTYTYDNKPLAIRALNFLPTILAGNANNITSDTTINQAGIMTATLNTTYTYDGNGNVVQRRDIDKLGDTTKYTYLFQCH